MQEDFIIIENGGTKADWFVQLKDCTLNFSTRSLHAPNFEQDIKKYREVLTRDVRVFVFSSGCLHDSKAEQMRLRLKPVLGERILVKSDLHGAGWAALGENHGWVMISGTGSVLFEWSGSEPICIRGGEGPSTGDEGSAFYFGKLFLQHYYEELNHFKMDQKISLGLLEDVISNKGKIASMALLLKDVGDIGHIHNLNVHSFAEKHLLKECPSALSIVGSYGFNNQATFRQEFFRYGVEKMSFLERPIVNLIEQTDYFVE